MHLRGSLPKGQRGVGLIEVLIAVLVLAFGMLGMAGLQSHALRNNQSALERGMATVQIQSIADVMRADRVRATNGEYDITIDAAAPVVDPDDPGTATFRNVAIADWRQSLQQALNPTATGSIDCNGALCVITVRWDDSRAASGSAAVAEAEAQTITTQVEL
jgi:type IV pilus assembly protein PilV